MATLGAVSLWLALLISIFTAVAFAVCAKNQSTGLRHSAQIGLIAVACLLTLAEIILAQAVFTHNFQFEYVANETSINTSPLFLLSALWAGNAGSLLFWAWVLAIGSLIAIYRKWDSHRDLVPYAAMVLMLTEGFFALLLVAKISPFNQLSTAPPDGAGMNLMLQNMGMVFHPPALLAGYVLFAIPFAFAISTLLRRKNTEDWLFASRNYTLLAWLLLGIGNIIGAWWAYVELGWGGYWAWDPVENAGLMPWLMATAFLHSSVMQRRKGSFKIWNLVLIIFTFCLVIFGTFLTRSGILNSVHTFTDTGITPYFMIFIAIALFVPLVLLYLRYDSFRGESANESFLSREGTFILNNIFLVGTTIIILLGTIFPSMSEAIQGVKISLDASFFNKVNGPLFLLIIILAGICTMVGWRQATLKELLRKFLWPAVAAAVLSVILALSIIKSIPAAVFISICLLIFISILSEWYREISARHRSGGENHLKSWWGLIWSNSQHYGGYIVHTGIILIAVGVIGSSFYSQDKTASLNVGDSLSINRYVLTYKGLTSSQSPDTTTVGARIEVSKGGKLIDNILPEKTFQNSSNQPVTEVAIRYGLDEDLYVILQGWQNNGSPADFEVLVKPLVSWIWIGGVVFLIGGLVTFWPGRRQKMAAASIKQGETEVSVAAVPREVSPQATRAIEDEIEKQIVRKRQQTGINCSKCGSKNKPSARFCSKCGDSLSGGRKNG